MLPPTVEIRASLRSPRALVAASAAAALLALAGCGDIDRSVNQGSPRYESPSMSESNGRSMLTRETPGVTRWDRR